MNGIEGRKRPLSFQSSRRERREFFELPEDIKKRYKRNINSDYLGWVGVDREATNPKRPGDLKEAFNFSPNGNWGQWPDDLCPTFRRTTPKVFQAVADLSMRILEIVAIGLKLPNHVTKELLDSHSLVGKPGNHTEIRALYFPPLEQDRQLEEGQVRMGEHFTFGTLSLMFQHEYQGLEVCNVAGEYVTARHIPCTALLFIGDTLQRQTADILVATKNRCLLPADVEDWPRQSTIVYFSPNDYSIVRCLDGSEKYDPVPYLDHLDNLMHAIYH
ncbi:hypothetical protein ScPMuIL_013273 [Solemya velum]